MSHQIRYTDKNGKAQTHNYIGSDGGAKSWAESLSRENDGRKATAVHIANGPFDHSGKERHIITVGDDNK